MRQRRSMRTALVLAFVVVITVPGVVATVAGVVAFRNSMDAEALRTSKNNIRIASDMATERMERKAAVLQGYASATQILDSLQSRKAVPTRSLKEAASVSGCTYVVAVDTSGRVVGASSGPTGASFGSYRVVFNAVTGKVGTGFQRLDPAEIRARGLDAAVNMPVKATTGGTVRHKQLEGAMALVSAVPVLSRDGHAQGALVGFEVLNGSASFVDDVTDRLGGTVTVFQDEVRIATTVRLDSGDRAVGTVAMDKVQEKVLGAGQPYEGIATVVGKPYHTAYTPLRDGGGKTMGMLYVGFPTAPYEAATRLFALRFIGAAAAGLALAIGTAVWLAGALTRPLAAVGAAAEQVADRDLTASAPVDGTKETAALGAAFNKMVSTLSAVITRASSSATALRSIAEDLQRQSESQAQSASRQASAVAETTATLEELAATYASVAKGAEEVMHLAEDAVEAAQEGRSALESNQQELERLFSGAERVAGAATGVSDAAAEIEGAVGIIESIAEQTKILALNAAIEASRAGEAGKGFSVVASEIRQLADSVSASTSRIGAVVGRIQEATKGLTDVSADQNRMAEKTVDLGHRTASAFGDILEKMLSTAAAARQIATAAVQQRTASNQVVQAMQQVSVASEETAATAIEMSRSAQDVRGTGVEIDEDLRDFRI